MENCDKNRHKFVRTKPLSSLCRTPVNQN